MAMIAVKGDWRSGVALMIVVGAGAGWRQWPMRAAIWLALAYATLGIVATMIRFGWLAGLDGALTSTFFAMLLAVMGHGVGASLRQARDAALASGKRAAAQIARSVSQIVTRERAPAPGAYAPGWGRTTMTAAAEAARPRTVVATPKNWKPVVSPPRRGLFR